MPTKKTGRRYAAAKKKQTAAKGRSRGKSLSARKDHIRSGTVSAEMLHGLAMAGPFGRVVTAYAELPARLLACRSPMQFWTEYMRFGQRLFTGFIPNLSPGSLHRAQPRARNSRGRDRA